MLLNAITAKNVDEYFKDEIKAELGKYGYIKKIHVHVRAELEEDLQVRVFIEYAKYEIWIIIVMRRQWLHFWQQIREYLEEE